MRRHILARLARQSVPDAVETLLARRSPLPQLLPERTRHTALARVVRRGGQELRARSRLDAYSARSAASISDSGARISGW